MQNNKPIITAIITTYRRPQLLRRAIRSVLNQTYPYLKVLVCDDASNDETAKVVAELMQADPRVIYHYHPKNIGMVANYNFGLSQVETPYFSILSDDDVILPNFYADAMIYFEKYPKAMIVGGVTVEINKEGKVFYPAAYSWEKELYVEPPQSFLQYSIYHHFPHIDGTIYRQEIIKEVGLFDSTLPRTCDLDYALRLSSRFPYVMFPNLCAIFKPHNQSVSVLNASTLILKEFPKLIQKVSEDKIIPSDIRNLGIEALKKAYGSITFRAGLVFTAKGNFREGLEAASLLKQLYKYRWKALGLKLIVKNSQYFKPLHRLVIWAYQFWKTRTSRITATFDAQEYEKLAKYLEL